MKLDEKALEAARKSVKARAIFDPIADVSTLADTAIRAYLTSATPPDVAELVETLEAIEIVRIRANIDALGTRPIEAANRAIRQAATALRLSAGDGVPEGWKLVPVDPTPEMIGAFWRQKNCGTQEIGERGPQTDDYSSYRAMLAASPNVEAGHVPK